MRLKYTLSFDIFCQLEEENPVELKILVIAGVENKSLDQNFLSFSLSKRIALSCEIVMSIPDEKSNAVLIRGILVQAKYGKPSIGQHNPIDTAGLILK